MNSSDIIAIVAILISAIVSTVSLVISYKSHLATIAARRSEIALERRLEAFKEMVQYMGQFRDFINQKSALNDPAENQSFSKELGIKYQEGFQIYQKHRIFFPPNIDSEITRYSGRIKTFLDSEDYYDLELLKDDILKMERSVVMFIQEFIGAS